MKNINGTVLKLRELYPDDIIILSEGEIPLVSDAGPGILKTSVPVAQKLSVLSNLQFV